MISLRRFLGDPISVERAWLLETIPVWKKDETVRLETVLKTILKPKLSETKFPSKEILQKELKTIPNLGGLRIRNSKSDLFLFLTSGKEFPNLSQISSFTTGTYFVDFYLGRPQNTGLVEFPKTGITSAFYYFSEDEVLLYSQNSPEHEEIKNFSFSDFQAYFKSRKNSCRDCEVLRLSSGTLFLFPSQTSISFWFRFGVASALCLAAALVLGFFLRSFLIRNRETLRKAIQSQKDLDQEKKSILSR
ncbi:hypothetical protein EHQ12_11100 [Leptospira gomenensis]|uniref:Uncharacterized protein n=1 Tax=Leptospira gomenensis TaxID=2484974 RepID=A0A5F1YT04_9LEPT|nr:hypothetical protein EHQ17_07120 [Leptospira gomenensis]TGK37417.1 hypothetical protein EHQ12_11100 [Leptospira gomenensis]TGK41105.1 hypothetical protein EHQ07_16880 [Leptospira gomenensis]TGK61321.1 hypothetical protein EHQ13_09560 [Leptospira gomenensis]